MNKALLIFFLFFSCLSITAQSYLGYVKTTVNFRSEPSTSSTKLASLEKGRHLFVMSNETINNYYHVVDIETNSEGYIHSSYVKLGKQLPKSKEGILKQVGKTISSQTIIRIHNKSDKKLILWMNDYVFELSPNEKITQNLPEGTYNFTVFAQGKTPEYGTQIIDDGYEYIWSYDSE